MGDKKATATLGGFDLLLEDEPVGWTLQAGTEPAIRLFSMSPDDAKAIAAVSGPVTLVITPVEGGTVTVSHLWALSVQPGPNPRISRVRVADRRWFWSRSHVTRRYNMRRAVGVKRLIANASALQVDFDRAPDIAYWYWSLDEGQNKWTPYRILSDVFAQVAQIERSFWGPLFKVVVDSRISQDLPIEDLEIDEAGDSAIMRALAMLPEAAVTVDYDGTVIVFSRASGDEVGVVTALMPEIWGGGHTDLISNAKIRPKEIHVLFTREVELRFDFLENASGTGTQVQRDGDLRQMDNVLPVPDYATDGASGRMAQINSRTLPQGAWVTFDQFFGACPKLPILNGIEQTLDHLTLQRAFIPKMDLWSCLGLTGIFPDVQDGESFLNNWVGRIGACKLHYRQTFRLPTRWIDRMLSFRAYRLATIDPQSGQRGPSMAYGDYCILPSMRTSIRTIMADKPLNWAINKTAYPTGAASGGGVPPFDDTALPSPGVISVLDMDQGVIRVEYAMDQVQSYEQVLPSQVKAGTMPVADLTTRTQSIAFNAIIKGVDSPRLTPEYKMATILSCVPASPNNNMQLHRIVVAASDVAHLLPASAQAGLAQADGPIMEVRIGAGTEVARIRWSDTPQDVLMIEKIFGLRATGFGNGPGAQKLFSQELENLTLNVGSTQGKSGASLNQIAQAQAASIYASLADHYSASFTAHMNGGVHLGGWIDRIDHEYTDEAATITKVVFPAELPQLSLFSFLSKSERAVILKLVQP